MERFVGICRGGLGGRGNQRKHQHGIIVYSRAGAMINGIDARCDRGASLMNIVPTKQLSPILPHCLLVRCSAVLSSGKIVKHIIPSDMA